MWRRCRHSKLCQTVWRHWSDLWSFGRRDCNPQSLRNLLHLSKLPQRRIQREDEAGLCIHALQSFALIENQFGNCHTLWSVCCLWEEFDVDFQNFKDTILFYFSNLVHNICCQLWESCCMLQRKFVVWTQDQQAGFQLPGGFQTKCHNRSERNQYFSFCDHWSRTDWTHSDQCVVHVPQPKWAEIVEWTISFLWLEKFFYLPNSY